MGTFASEDDYIEFRFVTAALKKYGYKVYKAASGDIANKNLIKDGELKSGISWQVERIGQKGGKLTMDFPMHGRFIEIQYHKKSTNAQKLSSINRDIWGVKENRPRKRKDTRWYTHNVYGELNSLIGELMYGLTDAVKAQMRRDLVDQFKTQ